MPLSWNEIRNRAHEFSKRWEGESSERAEAQSFWNEFFSVFGIERKRVAVFEKQVQITRAGQKLKHGRIDAFWKGVLLIEHKSLGQDLSRAFAQAADYFEGLAERDLPRYILVSDFARFRLYDLEEIPSPAGRGDGGEGNFCEFRLADLHKRIKHFAFIAGYRTQTIAPQNPVNIKAAERMGRLHDALKAAGYEGHPLEVLLVRLLFCLFAEDTGIFQPASAFRAWIEERTTSDGSDLGPQLAQLFQILNTPEDRRAKTLDDQLAAFPYVNGKLFEEMLPIASFNLTMREALLDCCALDWSSISPAIFGALFQSIMDAKARRNLGAHYTSEENILKLIQPLFLDELREEFKRVRGNKNKLFEFHKKLRTLTFFDPACGCGNFLVIAYRELRKLELDVLRAVHAGPGSRFLDIHQEISVNVDQFFGIEIEEFPAQIAQVALWLMDHQMNVRVSEEFGMYFARIPLKTSPHIVNGNALTLDWNDVLPAERASYVFGNPPFVGHQWRNADQMADMERIWGTDGRFGRLDYVSCWYRKAADYMRGNAAITCALVSTNSICQGEQVGTLWGYLLEHGVRIHFAHRTFQWSNEARGMAAVHCVIIGFALHDATKKTIFEYEDIKGEPHAIKAANINPYLVDAPNVILPSRTTTPPGLPQLIKGSQPTDGGHLILTEDEKAQLLAAEPQAKKWLRPYIGGEELINGSRRWCLWLKGISPTELREMPLVRERVRAVAQSRLESPTKSVQEFASQPTLFTQDRQPDNDYLAVPEVSSENRRFIPIGFLSSKIVASNKLQIIAGGTLYHFGILNSTMHNAWMRTVAGRLESRYSYAPSVYNNFPWPEPSDTQRQKIEEAAQAVLDARAQFPQSSLADLYDPLTMPPALVKAHQALDRAVDACYRKAVFTSDAQRVEFLFERYQQLTSLLPMEKKTIKRKLITNKSG
jgi:hypothetical protein